MKTIKEINADNMFKKLGYTKLETKYEIQYSSEFKLFKLDKRFNNIFCEDYFGLDELQAINKKCKELKWLD